MIEDLPEGYEKWQSIYPVYLNSSRSLKEGRRLPLAKAVKNPTAAEIFEAMNEMGFTDNNIRKESKVYETFKYQLYIISVRYFFIIKLFKLHPKALFPFKEPQRNYYFEYGRIRYSAEKIPTGQNKQILQLIC